MSDITYVVSKTKRIEALLKELGAKGEGLVPMASSIKNVISEETVEQIRKIASERNKIVHEVPYDALEDRGAFDQLCNEVENSLRQTAGHLANPGAPWLVFVIILGIIIYYLIKMVL